MHAWIDVAVLAKAKGMNGRFVARSAAGLPFLLDVGMKVAFVPPQLDAPREAHVSDVRVLDGFSAEVAFEGVDGTAASVLAGSHCLVERSDVDDGLFDESPGMWESFDVVDGDAGAIGKVTGFIDNPGQSLLEVERSDGSTVLVPAVDGIVRSVDVDRSVVFVDLPQGLLDL